MNNISVSALMGILVLVAVLPAVATTSLQPAYAEPKDKIVFRDNGVFADAIWHEEKPGGTTIDTFMFVVESSAGTDIFVERFVIEPDGTFTGQFGFAFTREDVFDVSKRLKTATLSPTEIEVCTFDEETGECSFDTLTLEAEWVGTGDLSRVKSKASFKAEDFRAKFSQTVLFREATATGSLGESSFGESEFAEVGQFKRVEMIAGQL